MLVIFAVNISVIHIVYLCVNFICMLYYICNATRLLLWRHLTCVGLSDLHYTVAVAAAAAGVELFRKKYNTYTLYTVHTISSIIEKRRTALFLSTIDTMLNDLISDLKSNFWQHRFYLGIQCTGTYVGRLSF